MPDEQRARGDTGPEDMLFGDGGIEREPMARLILRDPVTPQGPAEAEWPPFDPDPYLRAARRMGVKNGWLVPAIAEQEYRFSVGNPWTKTQDALAAQGRYVGDTFGPAQLSPDHMGDLEKWIQDGDHPEAVKNQLLPRTWRKDERVARARDPEWAATYTAAYARHWETKYAGRPPVEIVEGWNEHPGGGALGWVTSPRAKLFYKNWWREDAPRRQRVYGQMLQDMEAAEREGAR